MPHTKSIFLHVTPLLLAFVFMTACKNNEKKENAKELPASSDGAPIAKMGWPKPDSLKAGIPIYNTFDRLEPLFHFNNDTTYVINFWATWCKPCIAELPYFEAFNSNQKKEKVKVVLVSLDFPDKIESNLVPFVKKWQLKSEVVVLLDGKYNNWIDKVSPDWSGAIPATYIYKKEQNQLVADPFENLEELTEVVKPFLFIPKTH
ncbi:redoxin domain-containing protein [Arenibacter sp. F20364]|uniref:redoxin domain-containing protein n=1 Tax=Arenibacter sp. F20364 TaxID=2926415 RepID=UPI001FF19B1A|nr:redoxin domain-containing protein [Arenibacter sp. F20364]MCK0188422.1 redoxin domain-containing protein [Arenibacter sp. F20364]